MKVDKLKYAVELDQEQFTDKIKKIELDLKTGKMWLNDRCETQNKSSRFVRWIKCVLSKILPIDLFSSIKIRNVVPYYFKLIEKNKEYLKDPKVLESAKNVLEFLKKKTNKKYDSKINTQLKAIDLLNIKNNESNKIENSASQTLDLKNNNASNLTSKTPLTTVSTKATTIAAPKMKKAKPISTPTSGPEIPLSNSSQKTNSLQPPVNLNIQTEAEVAPKNLNDTQQMWIQIAGEIQTSSTKGKAEVKLLEAKFNTNDFFKQFIKKYPLDKTNSGTLSIKTFSANFTKIINEFSSKPTNEITFNTFERFVNYFGRNPTDHKHILLKMNSLINCGLLFGQLKPKEILCSARANAWCLRIPKDQDQIRLHKVIITDKNKKESKFEVTKLTLRDGMLSETASPTAPEEIPVFLKKLNLKNTDIIKLKNDGKR